MPKMNSETSVRGSARAQHRAPGSRASTVQADVWNLCFRAVSRSRTGLSKYFHLLLSHPACSQRAPEGKIWPVPLPFPDPSRLQFHGTPTFDPGPFLDSANREAFYRPLDHAKDLHEVTDPIPHVQLRCSKDAQLSLLHELDRSKRLALLPLDAVRRGLECGLFAIPKDELRDRLNMDARPAQTVVKTVKVVG